MTAVKSTEKPAKPYPEFPLFAHSRGYWAKTYKGKQIPCGPWADPKGAFAYWERKRNELELGIVSTASKGDHTTVEDVVNAFLDAKDAAQIAGHITKRTFNGYRNQCACLVDALGRHIPAEELRPAHFTQLRKKFPESWVYASQRSAIVHTKMVFKWAVEDELISRPINFGSVFKLPKGPSNGNALRMMCTTTTAYESIFNHILSGRYDFHQNIRRKWASGFIKDREMIS